MCVYSDKIGWLVKCLLFYVSPACTIAVTHMSRVFKCLSRWREVEKDNTTKKCIPLQHILHVQCTFNLSNIGHPLCTCTSVMYIVFLFY